MISQRNYLLKLEMPNILIVTITFMYSTAWGFCNVSILVIFIFLLKEKTLKYCLYFISTCQIHPVHCQRSQPGDHHQIPRCPPSVFSSAVFYTIPLPGTLQKLNLDLKMSTSSLKRPPLPPQKKISFSSISFLAQG